MRGSLRVLVLGGGPDRERGVSLKSAAAVAAALRRGGHEVIESDIGPDDLSALDGRFDVVFPVLHGRWGEGGDLQRALEGRGLRFVGCGSRASQTGIDKGACKRLADKHGVPTAPYQILGPTTPLTLEAPLVFKPLTEGSSFGVEICRSPDDVPGARRRLHEHFAYGMAERFVEGRETTVGVLEGRALPPIMIVPAAAFYDFEAKYARDDTRYEFDTGLPAATLDAMAHHALTMFRAVGCRHLSRVDFIVDAEHRPWFLEINTLPGFTDHSLLPMAAAQAGIPMPELCDRLIRLALEDGDSR